MIFGIVISTMPILIVDLDISAHDYLAMYQGTARNVFAISRDSTSIQFPVNSLRPFVTSSGIQGSFSVRFDDSHKLLRVDHLP